MDRRTFLHATGAGAGLLALGGIGSLPSSDLLRRPPAANRHPLRFPRSVSPRDLTLVAQAGEVEVAGTRAGAWTFGGDVPGPTIRARRGDRAQILLRNALAEPTVVHWHGLHVPVEADGHPRLAIPPGATLPYAFTVDQRAGMHWYHPHAHMRTAAQVYHGLAGLFIVADDEEDALGLPAGDREILLVLQDRRTAGGDANVFQYDAAGPDMMQGFLGDTPFGNGVPLPSLAVDSALYRLRILNGSNARIYRLALDGGASFTVVGNDGGLLPAPARADQVDLAHKVLGESVSRVDFRIVDRPGVDAPAGSCSGMISTHVFQHLSGYDGLDLYLREAYAALEPGASICFQTPVPGAQKGDIPSLQYRAFDYVRTRFNRATGKLDFMEYRRYPANRIVDTLASIGYQEIEVRIFAITATQFRQSFFFARKPRP